MPFLSIIVPVYKVEDYVGQCLSSILETGGAQPDDYELIVVNDGTPDNSMDIVRDVCEGHKNVKIIEQYNQGLSAARMAGLANATGDYIWFIDSDDWLVENSLVIVCDLLHKHPDIEVFISPLRWRYDCSTNDKTDISLEDNYLSNGREIQYEGVYPIWASQRYIIRRDLFHDKWLYFPKGLYHEDEYFGRVLMYRAGSVLILKDPLYNYRQRQNSIMSNIRIRTSYDIVSIYKAIMLFAKSNVLLEDRNWFDHNAFRFLLGSYTKNSSRFRTREFLRFQSKSFFFIVKACAHDRALSVSERIKTTVFLLFPRIYLTVFPNSFLW